MEEKGAVDVHNSSNNSRRSSSQAVFTRATGAEAPAIGLSCDVDKAFAEDTFTVTRVAASARVHADKATIFTSAGIQQQQ